MCHVTWKKEADEKREDGGRGFGYDKIGSALDLEGLEDHINKTSKQLFSKLKLFWF